ncbi:MAG: 6-phosphofructokinase [Candidatus Goldbacteria bacterium]|nr:6-phosphofructokinase [Candidatus Goldiibacteriota bacterium]
MKRIAVMTTGGDAPGMNAAIRAVARTAIFSGLEIFGVEEGFNGLLENKFVEMTLKSVSGIINRGGTILRTVRSKDFQVRSKRKIAYEYLKDKKIEGLIVIGGDGSKKGADIISKENKIPVSFIPASIDNDVYGTDMTIGFDTAVNVGLDAIDKIRDTASSHERIFIIEVMGREHGFLALEIGLTGGAEVILVPELKKDVNTENICKILEAGIRRGKDSSIIVKAEGFGKINNLAQKIESYTGMETRYTVLGYIQRGGIPTALSRKLGLVFGYEAVSALLAMKKGECKMIGFENGKFVKHNIKDVMGKEKKIDKKLYDINKIFTI